MQLNSWIVPVFRCDTVDTNADSVCNCIATQRALRPYDDPVSTSTVAVVGVVISVIVEAVVAVQAMDRCEMRQPEANESIRCDDAAVAGTARMPWRLSAVLLHDGREAV